MQETNTVNVQTRNVVTSLIPEFKSPFFVGVDGGGTKTRVAVIDAEGVLMSEVVGSSSNVAVLGIEKTFDTLRGIFNEITIQIPELKQHVGSMVLGLAGISDSESTLKKGLLEKLKKLTITDDIHIFNDGYVAWFGTDHGLPAIALISGTGSACFGVDANKKCIVKGGMGHVLSDEGSGYQIGLMGLRRAMRAHKGLEAKTALMPVVAQFFSLKEIDEAPYRIREHKEIAAFARKVYEVSLTGDPVATQILEQAARDLSILVEAVWREGDFRNNRVKVGVFGGCLDLMSNLRNMVHDQLDSTSHKLKLCNPIWSPERAAAEMARSKTLGRQYESIV